MTDGKFLGKEIDMEQNKIDMEQKKLQIPIDLSFNMLLISIFNVY